MSVDKRDVEAFSGSEKGHSLEFGTGPHIVWNRPAHELEQVRTLFGTGPRKNWDRPAQELSVDSPIDTKLNAQSENQHSICDV